MSSLRVAVVVATFVAVCHATPPIYVDSLHGSDGNSGASPTAALASITAAQSAARKVLAAGPLADDLNVLIAPGDYALSATLTLDASDSGSAGALRSRRFTHHLFARSTVGLRVGAPNPPIDVRHSYTVAWFSNSQDK